MEGYRGAMFPWQSGSSGREETQEVHYNPIDGTWGADLSRRQRHVNAAIAYNLWQYYASPGTATSSRTTAPRCCSRSPASSTP